MSSKEEGKMEVVDSEEESSDDEAEDDFRTTTMLDQAKCESVCARFLRDLSEYTQKELEQLLDSGMYNDAQEVVLLRDRHAAYAAAGLRHLPGGFICLDASRAWLLYWMLHSLDLLLVLEDFQPPPPTPPLTNNTSSEGSGTSGTGGVSSVKAQALLHMDTTTLAHRAVVTLSSFQCEGGGFGGGPQQLAHCAPTYAAVLALLIIGTPQAYDAIDRGALYRWFLSLKTESGGFRMHHDGEVDVRGTYTVMAVASLLNLLTPQVAQGVTQYLVSCQTYEGGFGGEPCNEAHGGYTFCALAALVLLGTAQQAQLHQLQLWLCQRQMSKEGGFQGRAHKLVDGCYSFWQGGACALLEVLRRGKEEEATGWAHPPGHKDRAPLLHAHPEHEMVHSEEPSGVSYDDISVVASTPQAGDLCFDQHALQRYILHCAQAVEGGLRDKPGKPRDFYHSCYCLSGLSVAQWGCYFSSPKRPVVYGDMDNLLAETSPVYNIRDVKVQRAIAHFATLPGTHEELLQA